LEVGSRRESICSIVSYAYVLDYEGTDGMGYLGFRGYLTHTKVEPRPISFKGIKFTQTQDHLNRFMNVKIMDLLILHISLLSSRRGY
jgi:hypothetical protein